MKEYEMEFSANYYLTTTQIGLWPLRAGQNYAKENYHIGPRLIDYYSFHFVTEGEVVFVQNNEAVHLKKGDLYCLFPYKVYQYYTLSTNPPLCMNWLAFSEQDVKELLRVLGFTSEHSYIKIDNYYDLHVILKDIYSSLDQLNEQKLDQVMELQSLLYKLFQNLLGKASQLPSLQTPDWFKLGKSYMQKHYTEGITIEDVARHLGIHRSYFSDQFTNKYHISPIKYLQKLRMEKGIDMLKHTDYTVTEIALSIGYPNLYSFSRAFNKHFHIPPTKYRKLHNRK